MSLEHIVLILRGHVVGDLVNQAFWLTLEPAPDAPYRRLTARIHGNANEAKASVQLLRIGLGPHHSDRADSRFVAAS